MKVVFRVDASIEIGFGHVMRCLTLAEPLRAHGHDVHFVCCTLKGHLAQKIEQKGFDCLLIQKNDWQTDAGQTNDIIAKFKADWLIVDHYQLDYRWHRAVRNQVYKIMAIDDLANRNMDCDLLLDTGMGKLPADYQELVPAHCKILTGIEYALIRSEFSGKREAAISRRVAIREVKNILINLGGMDQLNLIPGILARLMTEFKQLEFTIIVSSATPNLIQIQQQVKNCRTCRLLLDIDNMAEEILFADLAIGAAGITAYERCVLGLPAITVAVADNQQHFLSRLVKAGAVLSVKHTEKMPDEIVGLCKSLMGNVNSLQALSSASFELLDTNGATRVVKALEAMA